MIGEDIKLKYESKYIQSVLKEDSEYIVSEQRRLIQQKSLIKTGGLLQSLNSNVSVRSAGAGGAASIQYIGLIRLLDMKNKKRKSYRLYNRILYGVIYNRTVAKISFGYSEEIIRKLQSEEIKIKL